MNIISDESLSELYAIISYAHEDKKAVESELEAFDKKGICYWSDVSMTRGENWEDQFFNILDNRNCKGIIFFVSNPYLESVQCAREMAYFKEHYGIKNPDKFCFFILPNGYPRKDKDIIKAKVLEYAKTKMDEKMIDETKINGHIDLFLELNQNGKALGGKLGNVDNYIELCCKEGDLFYKYEILDGHRRIGDAEFGYFPQTQEYNDSYEGRIGRDADKGLAYYAPLDWFIIKDTEKEQTLLSKKLLFAIDYLGLKYPYNKNETKTPEKWKEYHQNNKTVEEWLEKKFKDLFKLKEDKGKIKKVRFLLEGEFKKLYKRTLKDISKQRELFLPEVTYFAQISTRKNVCPYWLIGDVNDAKRFEFDAAAEAENYLSGQRAGVELHYVRIVIEVEK
jgi:hypothetical protein